VRAEKATADKVADAEHSHDGRSENEEVRNEAVKGAKVKVHGAY
jgi:hypothetical protein